MNLNPQLNKSEPPASTSARTSVDDDATGLPAFSSWRAVYAFVFVVFVVYVVLLRALSQVYA